MKINKYIGEILSLMNQETEEDIKIKILRENKSTAMMQLFRFAYDPQYVSLISNIPKYRLDDSPYGYSYSDLLKEVNIGRLNYLFDFPNKKKIWKIYPRQQFRILMGILEKIHWSDAAILSSILTTKSIPNLPLEFIQKAFPDFTISKEQEETTDE